MSPASGDGYSMDRPRESDPRRRLRQVGWVGLGIAAIAVFVGVDRVWLRPGEGISAEDLATATVARGTLAIEVQGVGELEPVNERWIAAEVGGAVERILARAGERVAAGDVVARLINPQLGQAAVAARLQLAEANADLRRRLAELADRRLAGEAAILDRQAHLEELELQLEAHTELRERKAVSEIDYKSARIRAERARTELGFEQRRAELEGLLDAERAASEARVAARESALAEAERLAESLEITTDLAGTLREVLVEPGERVVAGTQVARVVGTEALRGRIRVPESYASRVAPGQPAVVTILGAALAGTVTRVDPAVTQNSVAIEVELTDELPPGARPELSIRGTVTVAELEDALYVRRPLRVRDDSTVEVYRLANDGASAARTVVQFGLGTLRHVEVVDGLDEGDTVIVGSTTSFEDDERIAIR